MESIKNQQYLFKGKEFSSFGLGDELFVLKQFLVIIIIFLTIFLKYFKIIKTF